ncbi:MAG: tetratricopeptide repeat protein [Phycisphaerae bacterium]|nr:tetratricopeptide repeat protein [Phycisphaerae bacterium]MDW8261337.1 tetratricopeptide repeat protein [Phycisphaerales bacterium]
MTSERQQKLLAMLSQSPSDPFLLYAMGMECRKLGDFQRAIEYFRKTVAADPQYCYAYYQLGQTCELLQQPDLARQAYTEGIAAAEVAGDHHARQEIEAALRSLD